MRPYIGDAHKLRVTQRTVLPKRHDHPVGVGHRSDHHASTITPQPTLTTTLTPAPPTNVTKGTHRDTPCMAYPPLWISGSVARWTAAVTGSGRRAWSCPTDFALITVAVLRRRPSSTASWQLRPCIVVGRLAVRQPRSGFTRLRPSMRLEQSAQVVLIRLRNPATVISTTRSCPHCRSGRATRLANRMAGWRISTVHATSAQVPVPSGRSRN